MKDSIPKGTILSALMWASSELKEVGIESYRLDAELLLSEVMKISRVQLYVNFDRPMSQKEKEDFLYLIRRRKKREPVAYILNQKEFMSLKFYVDKNVLIPRPETECMVEWILKNIKITGDSKILDLGTGSGCIAASILRYSDAKKVFISDISDEALLIARRNIDTLCTDKEYIPIKSSLFEDIDEKDFDLIISNPPYIKTDILKSLAPEITEFEPGIALDGGESGDEIILGLIEQSYNHLKNDAILIFEHAEDFKLHSSIIKERFEIVLLGKDYSNRYRFTVLKKY